MREGGGWLAGWLAGKRGRQSGSPPKTRSSQHWTASPGDRGFPLTLAGWLATLKLHAGWLAGWRLPDLAGWLATWPAGWLAGYGLGLAEGV